MNAVLIDDDLTALTSLELKLNSIAKFHILGKFSDPIKASYKVINLKPDIVFLETKMEKMSGIKLAKKIKRLMPDTVLVFVTDTNESAVEAFDVGALDYILKPIQQKRLMNTVARLSKSKKSSQKSQPIVCLFRNLHFQYFNNDSSKITVKWRTSKSKELFAYLITHREKLIPKDIIIEMFWPNTSSKSRYTQLYTAIYNIRQTLKSIEFPIVIESIHQCYKLNLNGVLVDVDEFQKGITAFPTVTDSTIAIHKKTAELYKDDLLVVEEYLWAENERERIKLQWLNFLSKITNYYIINKSYSEGILFYLKLQNTTPHKEEIFFELMKLYDQLGDRFSVQEQYNLLNKILEKEFGTTPSTHIHNWFNNWAKNETLF